MKIDLKKKYQIYNSLFLSLEYQQSKSIGYLIPILAKTAELKLKEGINPIEIFDSFYDEHKSIIIESKIDFMFKVIQFVERQVVLFDSVEDSFSPYENKNIDSPLIENLILPHHSKEKNEQLFELLNDVRIRLVLTAHPTQFYRPSVLKIISDLRQAVLHDDVGEIDTVLNQLGLTSLVNSDPPTPLEEANNILQICRFVYYDAIGEFCYELSKRYPSFNNYESILLGFWPGGDRDGNPYVTHEVTRNVSDSLRMNLMKCYYNDFKKLRSKLTFKGVEELITKEVNRLYEAMFNQNILISHEDLLKSLQSIERILTEKFQNIYLEDVKRLIVKIKVFQSHFASLDIRQDHSIHKLCVEEILKQNNLIENSIDELSQDNLTQILMKRKLVIDEELFENEVCKDTIKNIRQLPEIQFINGNLGCHRYIISNSEDVYSVLFVFGLFNWIHNDKKVNFDFVPLFETMNGMDSCEYTMEQLYKNDIYRKHIQNRGDRQTMMLGFSDGTKDGGYLKANWAIYKSKEDLARASKKFQIEPVFFDGRGGPPARGGGKTHDFYASRSPDTSNGDIQLTIQGQTITSTYGTDNKFLYNVEQMITSGIVSQLKKETSTISGKNQKLIEELSDTSYDCYMELRNDPNFLPYLEEMTTLKYYSKTKIGSRPSKRSKDVKLKLEDLRAIAYVGSWSQLKQNVPGFYGVGTALQSLIEKDKTEDLKQLYLEEPFFRCLMDNCMMALTKCNFDLTSYIKSSNKFGGFWQKLKEEYELTKKCLLLITNSQTLMENDKNIKASITLRNDMVLPLLLVQNYALQKLGNIPDEKSKAIYEKLVVRSLYGNINASRNSA